MEFNPCPRTQLGHDIDNLNSWQRLDWATNGDEELYFGIVGAIRYPDNESELNPAFSLKATDNLANNA